MAEDIIQNLKKRDSRTISRCISLVENQQDSYLEFLSSIFPYTGNAYRIGITGAPGSGKSTLTDQLIKIIARLPGLGSRSARRIVLHLLKHKDTEMINISNELKQVAEKVKSCEVCGNLDTMNICNICSDFN